MAAPGDYAKQVHLSVSPDRVFEILTTAAEFASWWAPATGSATEGGELRITFDGFEAPLVLRVKQATRPSKVTWDIVSCSFLPEWVGTAPTFTLSEPGTGGCGLLFQHAGLSPQLECYDMCRAGWDQYLPGLRDYIDTGLPDDLLQRGHVLLERGPAGRGQPGRGAWPLAHECLADLQVFEG